MADKEKETVQDQDRESKMIDILGLIGTEQRMGHDAEDKAGNRYELKSTTKDKFGTGRDVSVEMIKKWRELYWIFATGPITRTVVTRLNRCIYVRQK